MQVLAFDVGELACAIGVSQVREVLEPRPVTRVPGAPPAAPAVFALRGGIVTVIDLALRLGVETSRGRPQWLVVDGPEGVGACALRTDGVTGLASVDRAALARPRGLAAAEDLLTGVSLQRDGPLLVLDLDRILDPEALRRASLSPRKRRRPAAPASADTAARAVPVLPSRSEGAADAEVWRPGAPGPSAPVSPRPDGAPSVCTTSNPRLPGHAPTDRAPTRPAPRAAARFPRSVASTVSTRAPLGPAVLSRRPGAVAGADPQPETRLEAPPVSPRAAPSTRSEPFEQAGPAVRPARRSRVGLVAGSAIAAMALAALLSRWSGSPAALRQAQAERVSAVERPPVAIATRDVGRELVPSPPAPRRLAAGAAPAPETSSAPRRLVAAPSPAPPSGGDLTVVRGDTLWRLAGVHLGASSAWPRLYAANRGTITDPDRISPGQRLALPAGGAHSPTTSWR